MFFDSVVGVLLAKHHQLKSICCQCLQRSILVSSDFREHYE